MGRLTQVNATGSNFVEVFIVYYKHSVIRSTLGVLQEE